MTNHDAHDDRTGDDATSQDAQTTVPASPAPAVSARDIASDVVARVLARAGTARAEGGTRHTVRDGEQLDLEERTALRRVAGLSTELEDVTEVEYRQLRLERVVLVGVWYRDATEAEVSLRELAALAETAGSLVLDGVLQRRQTPDPGTYLGSGKAAELAAVVAATGADTVIVDGELAPSQRRALEDIIKVKVVDRTALILDIFAQHAKSREGKAQVELAQLEYLLPRLRGWGESMSRQAGGQVGGAGAGMGSRGPGETKIELDRRRIRNRMAKLKREIAAMAPSRATMRSSRRRNAVPAVAIAGYTNAGKSSLLNSLTGAGVLVENALFATLDPTVRRTKTPDGRVYTLPTPSGSSGPCRTSSSRRSAPPSRRWVTPTSCSTWSTRPTPTRRGRSRPCGRSLPASPASRTSPRSSSSTRPTSRTRRPSRGCAHGSATPSSSPRTPGRASTSSSSSWRRPCRTRGCRSTSWSPTSGATS
jgi:GTPase